jgi:hypothetical protein
LRQKALPGRFARAFGQAVGAVPVEACGGFSFVEPAGAIDTQLAGSRFRRLGVPG